MLHALVPDLPIQCTRQVVRVFKSSKFVDSSMHLARLLNPIFTNPPVPDAGKKRRRCQTGSMAFLKKTLSPAPPSDGEAEELAIPVLDLVFALQLSCIIELLASRGAFRPVRRKSDGNGVIFELYMRFLIQQLCTVYKLFQDRKSVV